MKRHLLIALSAASIICLPACSIHDQQQASATVTTTAGQVSAGVSALPPALILRLQSLAAAHPTIAHDLAAVATALNVVSAKVSKLPSPDTLQTYLLWVQFSPELAAYSNEFLSAYRTFYPALSASNDALSKIAAVIQATGSK